MPRVVTMSDGLIDTDERTGSAERASNSPASVGGASSPAFTAIEPGEAGSST